MLPQAVQRRRPILEDVGAASEEDAGCLEVVGGDLDSPLAAVDIAVLHRAAARDLESRARLLYHPQRLIQALEPTMRKNDLLHRLPLVLLLLAGCKEEGMDSDTSTGSETAEPVEYEELCSTVCERVVTCAAQEFAPSEEMPGTCEWADADALTATCVDACVDTAEQSSASASCLECVSTNFACSGTEAFRPCDGICEGTPMVTGKDFEGAAEYAYQGWFFEDYSDPSLWTCP